MFFGLVSLGGQGMDALVQLYGPFDLGSDQLPYFDIDGNPVEGDTLTQLNSKVQIASSEGGCCKRLGSGIFNLVTPGRYVVIIFHCSIGHNENQLYKVCYNFDSTAKIRELTLDHADVLTPGTGRVVNQLYRVCINNGLPLVTQKGDIYMVYVVTDDGKTQNQVRTAVYSYSSGDILGQKDRKGRYVSHSDGFWGNDTVTFCNVKDV